jgi:acetyl esterase/lipase
MATANTEPLPAITLEERPAYSALIQKFNRHEITYKTFNSIHFPATILVPKHITSGNAAESSPIIAHFHGGGLWVGTSMEPFFTHVWLLELALSTGAVIVDPAYRLIPEGTGADIIDDQRDFWTWLHSGAFVAGVKSLYPNVTPDLDRIASSGESAGGYLVIQSALLFGELSKVKVVMPQYGATFTDIDTYNPGWPNEVTPEQHKLLDDYIAEHKGEIRLGTRFPWHPELVMAIRNVGGIRRMMGDDPRCKLAECLRLADRVAPMWFVQGADDPIVSCNSFRVPGDGLCYRQPLCLLVVVRY